jgi:hypothetical protein
MGYSQLECIATAAARRCMQAKELTRALDIESVLCLADRTPLGRVEEVRL